MQYFEFKDPKLQINDDLASLIAVSDLSERRLYLYGTIGDVDDNTEGRFDLCCLTATDIARFIIDINRKDNLAEAEAAKEGETFTRLPIWLYIDCLGGDVDEGMSLATVISLSKTPIYTVNIGVWYSMAFIIGICGTRRLSLPNARFMFHDGYKGAMGPASRVDEHMEASKRYERTVIKRVMLNHSNETFTDELYEKLYPHDNYLLAGEALGYGFIDEIVTDLSGLG